MAKFAPHMGDPHGDPQTSPHTTPIHMDLPHGPPEKGTKSMRIGGGMLWAGLRVAMWITHVGAKFHHGLLEKSLRDAE